VIQVQPRSAKRRDSASTSYPQKVLVLLS